MGRMADVGGLRDPCCEPPDRDQAPVLRQLLEERSRSGDLLSGRAAVRGVGTRMRGDDVPAEDVELELREDALDDRRRCLPRSAAGQLALGGERQAGDARAAVAGRFADEQEGGARSVFEIRTKPLPSEPCAGSLPIEVEGRTDASGGKSGYEPLCVHVVTMLMRVRGRTAALVAACAGVCVPAAAAAPPQGIQTDAAFAASYAQRAVTSVAATTQRISCYTPEVYY